MAVTLRTSTPLNLNDGVRYELVDFDLGETQRDEAWLESWWGDTPVLTARADRKTKMTIVLHVFGRNVAGAIADPNVLRQNVEAVRNEFSGQSNVVLWGFGGSLTNIPTYPSGIDPVPFEQQGYFAHNRAEVLRWTIQVWRGPYYQGQSVPMVI